MTLHIDIQWATANSAKGPSDEEIRAWATTTLKAMHKQGILAIKIVDEQEMTGLNAQYRKKEKSTNVLSFPCTLPLDLRGDFLGDIVICPAVVQQEALSQEKTFAAHFAHIVTHGVLHVLGFDHQNEEDAQLMESHEIHILKKLGFADPYKMEKTHE